MDETICLGFASQLFRVGEMGGGIEKLAISS